MWVDRSDRLSINVRKMTSELKTRMKVQRMENMK